MAVVTMAANGRLRQASAAEAVANGGGNSRGMQIRPRRRRRWRKTGKQETTAIVARTEEAGRGVVRRWRKAESGG